jgi:hypothetical protein
MVAVHPAKNRSSSETSALKFCPASCECPHTNYQAIIHAITQPKKVKDLPENLGEALTGDKAHTSGFIAKMKENVYCQTLCRKSYTPKQMEEFQVPNLPYGACPHPTRAVVLINSRCWMT